MLDPAGLERVWLQGVEQPLPPLMVPVEKVNVESVDEDGPWLPSRSWATSAGAAGAMAGDAAHTARWGYLLYGGFLIDPGLVDQMRLRSGRGLSRVPGHPQRHPWSPIVPARALLSGP